MRVILASLVAWILLCTSATGAMAQTFPQDSIEEIPIEATLSAEPATISGQVSNVVEERREKDITETGSQVKSRLARILDENPVGELTLLNFMQHGLRRAVNQGVPANVLVLLLLFPVIASFIAASRHIVGLQGFGVYAPAVLAVAFLSTGILTGLVLFTAIILVASIGRLVVKFFKLQYLPRTALLLWFVTVTVFGLMVLSPYLSLIGIDLIAVSIFPILVLILLSENFLEAMYSSSQSRALELTLETVLLAILSAIFVRTEMVQEFVILRPELTSVMVFFLDLAVGKYTGLRISEYFRFKPILDPEE